MSIINDALKKTQKNLSNKKDKNILKPGIDQTEGGSSPSDRKDTKLKILIILTLILIVIFMAILLVLVINKKPTDSRIASNETSNTQNQLRPRSLIQPSQSIPPAEVIRETIDIPVEAVVSASDLDKPLVLDGIMRIENKNVALINGDDYVEGDLIYEMEILRIESTHVEIKTKDGKILKISVKGK